TFPTKHRELSYRRAILGEIALSRRSMQSDCTLFLPASIRMYENSSGAVSRETTLPHHAFHSAICINCNSSSLIRQLSQSIIVYHQDEPRRCCQSYTHKQCS